MTKSNQTNIEIHKDPVCGMEVASDNNSNTAIWNNQTYYFCAQHCRDEFEKAPEAYQKKSPFFLVRWWNNYLKRLNKVTDGKPQCCD